MSTERQAWILFFLGLIAAAAWFHPAVAGSDLWWHLAAGRQIVEAGAVPATDQLSFTAAGSPWVNHEWAWAVVAWLAWGVGPGFLAWLNLIVVGAIFALFQLAAWRASGSLAGALIAVWLAAATSHWFLDIRPHLFGLLFTGLLLVTAKWKRAPWLWAPLMMVWCNTHGSWIFGFGLIGLIALIHTIDRSIEERRFAARIDEWVGVAACLPALLLNPWGLELLAYPLKFLDEGTAYRNLKEWIPPEVSFDPRLYAGRFWILFLLVLPGWLLSWKRLRLYALLAVVTFAMALSARRFIPLFALCSMPLIALSVAWAEEKLGSRARIPALRYAGATLLLIAALLGWHGVRLAPDLLARWTEGHTYPHAAVRYLNAAAPDAHVFNDYRWGGWLSLHAPDSRVFIDGRANTVYTDELYNDYISIFGGMSGYSLLLDEHAPEVVLLPPDAPIVRKLNSGRSGWRVVYSDPVAILFVSPDSERSWPDAESVVGDEPEYLLGLSLKARRKGDLETAARLAEQAIERDPLLVHGYAELAWIHASRRDSEEIERIIHEARRRYPRQGAQLEHIAAIAYRNAGDEARARRAQDRSTHTGPF